MNDETDGMKDLLREMGHSDEEIAKILVKLQEYEKETQLDSIMDSIGHGGFDLAALIDEALDR